MAQETSDGEKAPPVYQGHGAVYGMEQNKAWFQPNKNSACGGYLPATFWTVKHYDFLGIFDYTVKMKVAGDGESQTVEVPHKLFVDPELIEYIKACNERTFGQGQ